MGPGAGAAQDSADDPDSFDFWSFAPYALLPGGSKPENSFHDIHHFMSTRHLQRRKRMSVRTEGHFWGGTRSATPCFAPGLRTHQCWPGCISAGHTACTHEASSRALPSISLRVGKCG
jgi:hypothetical protein